MVRTEEIAAFMRTLQVVWRGESWENVEPHAERAWKQIPRLEESAPWLSVRDVIRKAWMP
jgi:hypothetical protein